METPVCLFVCMRRIQLFSAIEQLEQRGLIVVDIITLGGIVKTLAEATQTFDRSTAKVWEPSVQISVTENGARALVAIAHWGCKGHRASEQAQKIHLQYAAETLNSFRLGVPTFLFFQKEDNSLEQV